MDAPIWVLILSIVLSLGVGALAAYFMFNKGVEKGKDIIEQKFVQLGKDATKIIDDAKAEGENRKKELISEGKAEVASLKKQNAELTQEVSNFKSKEIVNEFTEINGKHVLLKQVKGLDKDMFSKLFDSLKVVHESSIVVLANVLEERIQLIAYVSKNLIPTYNAGKIIKDLTAIIGGSGGGRPDVAQGGGKDASKIAEAFDSLKKGF